MAEQDEYPPNSFPPDGYPSDERDVVEVAGRLADAVEARGADD
jgi:hypothetical protein